MENKFDDDLIIKRDSVVFSDQIPTTSPPLQQALFHISTCETDKTTYSLGFLDAQHDNYNTHTIFDLIIHTPPPPSHSQPAAPSPVASTSLPESSEVLNTTPPTPNSSSLSSSSNEATADQQQTSKTVEEDEEEDKTTKKQLKPKKKKKKKKKKKREREARFAFMTKSEVDNLDDGYRWRKYGQKAVKNSHFPRSYYRCTAASCGVKKRVERWCEDASIVVTTYEGSHTHPCPINSKHAGSGGLGIMPPATAPSFFPTTTTTTAEGGISSSSSCYCFGDNNNNNNNNVRLIPLSPSSQQLLHYPLQPTYFQTPTYSSSGAAAVLCAHGNHSISTTTTLHTNLLPVPQGRRLLPPSSLLLSSSSSLIRDHGLLQDMVPCISDGKTGGSEQPARPRKIYD